MLISKRRLLSLESEENFARKMMLVYIYSLGKSGPLKSKKAQKELPSTGVHEVRRFFGALATVIRKATRACQIRALGHK